jgi:hypothetical protein
MESFRRFYGPTVNAFEAAERSGKVEELHNQLLELAKTQNRGTNGGTSPAIHEIVSLGLHNECEAGR